MPLKYRVLTIVGLCLVSIFFLFPRNITIRERGADGVLHDTTVRHVPLQRGLDLKGGTYLALEVDDSKQAIPNDKKVEAIDRALKTVRSRIEGFGVSEAIVQKQGNDRIVVQIPGEQDPERARKLVEAQAFLEFKITDKSQALERALPKIDQIIKQRGLAAKGDTSIHDTRQPKGLESLLKARYVEEDRYHEKRRRWREEGFCGCGGFTEGSAGRRVLEPTPAGPNAWRVLHRNEQDPGVASVSR